MIILDTHVIIWLRTGDQRLGPRANGEIANALMVDNAAISAISFWEIGMRIQKNQINLGLTLDAWRRALIEDGLIEIPVDGVIAALAGLLTELHGDPADRLIVATALGGHRLVTADRRILDWPGNLDRLDAAE